MIASWHQGLAATANPGLNPSQLAVEDSGVWPLEQELEQLHLPSPQSAAAASDDGTAGAVTAGAPSALGDSAPFEGGALEHQAPSPVPAVPGGDEDFPAWFPMVGLLTVAAPSLKQVDFWCAEGPRRLL